MANEVFGKAIDANEIKNGSATVTTNGQDTASKDASDHTGGKETQLNAVLSDRLDDGITHYNSTS